MTTDNETPLYRETVAATGTDPLAERDRPVITDDGAVPASAALPPPGTPG